MLLQYAAYERVRHFSTVLVGDREPDLLLGPDVLVAAEVLLDPSLDLRAQLLDGVALLLYLAYLVSC